MAINDEGIKYGIAKIFYTDGTGTGYRDVKKITYMRNDILINFLSGQRMTVQRALVKTIQSDEDVYIAFAENSKPVHKVVRADPPSYKVGKFVDGIIVPCNEKTFDRVRSARC